MKTVEIFLDESGEIRDHGRLMNVSGIVLVSASLDTSEQYHRKFYQVASDSGLLAGLCDGASNSIARINPPRRYLSKRPRTGDGISHQEAILRLIGNANQAAKATGVEMAAFSLVFPCNSKKPWSALTKWENQLLDRSYLERLEDALELLFFETPWMSKHLGVPCQIALDLPTRSVPADLADAAELTVRGNILWKCWGMKNDGESGRELRTCSLGPADGAEILTSVLARRDRSLGKEVRIMGSRCVRLMDWETWAEKCPNPASRNTWSQKYLPPKQIHYLADFLSNAVYRGNNGKVIHQSELVRPWYQRGYLLNAAEADSWIVASRLFANGDRVGALRLLWENASATWDSGQTCFFRAKSGDWFPQLSGADLRTLFKDAISKRILHRRRIGRATVDGSKDQPSGSGDKPQRQEKPPPEILSLVERPRNLLSEAMPPHVRWRVMLVLPSTWTGQTLMDAVKESAKVPEPLCVRSFPKEDYLEFLLDLRSCEEVRAWIASPVAVGEILVEALDVTLPVAHRTAPHLSDGACQETS